MQLLAGPVHEPAPGRGLHPRLAARADQADAPRRRRDGEPVHQVLRLAPGHGGLLEDAPGQSRGGRLRLEIVDEQTVEIGLHAWSLLGQRGAQDALAARELALHGIDRDAADARELGIAEPVDVVEREEHARLAGHARERPGHVDAPAGVAGRVEEGRRSAGGAAA